MRHRMRGRKLGRNSSHRKAMFRNMACSLIHTVRVDEDDKQKPKVTGRIITTVAKAKELRPIVEKLITLARKAAVHEDKAGQFATTATRNSDEWKTWRDSDQWNQWAQAVAPAVTLRRRAFAKLRDHRAVSILFDELAERFQDRPGGYTRVVRLASVRLGDAGQEALIEFVGERDRVPQKRKAPVVTDESPESPTTDEAATDKTTIENAEESAEAQSAETGEATEESAADSSAAENADETEAEDDKKNE